MTFCTTVSMSFLWFLSALPTLSPAFIAPENSTNETGYNSIQQEVSYFSPLNPLPVPSRVRGQVAPPG